MTQADEKTWNSNKLYVFENSNAEGGTQILGLTFEEQGLLVFTMKDGFEIAWYGSDELWEEISSVLY